MAVSFREAREATLIALCENLIDDETFCLLYDLNKSNNLDLPYDIYEKFELDELCDDECKNEFRFWKNDIYQLHAALRIPDELICYNRIKVAGIEALCMFLKRFSYPCRYSDMVPRFARPVPQICIITNTIMAHIYGTFKHLLQDFNQAWLSPQQLRIFSDKIHDKGGPLQNCWGFIDGTVRPVCRPQENQRTIYNGHKRVHAIKFQSVVAPNGLIALLDGPYEGRKHDSGMLADSGLLTKLGNHSFDQYGQALCLYGDPAYPLRIHLQGPFRNAARGLNAAQADYNKAMSQVRTSVEWVFGDIVNYFSFLDYKKNLKIGLSSIGKMYITCALLRNAHTCIYSSSTSSYFDADPPTLMDYFQ